MKRPTPEDYHRSGFPAAVAFCGICLVACLGAAAPWGLSHGLLFAAAGLLMACFPPQTRRPGGWLILAALWLLGAMSAFFPAAAPAAGSWRARLMEQGLQLPASVSPQPAESAVMITAMAAAGVTALWILGQSLDTRRKTRIAMIWLSAVVVFAALDLVLRAVGEMPDNLPDFGFFPNRNHGADLLVSGAVVSLGLLIQSLRNRKVKAAVHSGMVLAFLSGCLLGKTSSRAGAILLVCGFAGWLALMGIRHVKGITGQVVSLVFIAAFLMFFCSDSTVKSRLEATVEKIELASSSDDASGTATEIDGRVGIARDTWEMISDNPLTGVGGGQFRDVFPQYRRFSAGTNGSDTLHPESSWLWIAAENGLPACASLIGLVAWIITRAAKDIRRPDTKARALRAAALVAALVPLFHSLFDVPAHRVGILWGSSLMCLVALPGGRRCVPAIQRRLWRCAGLAVLAFGCWLLSGELVHQPVRPTEATNRAVYSGMQALRAETAPAPESARPDSEDPLETAIAELDEALTRTPLNARALGLKGMLALHFDDKDASARGAFAAQRALEPTWVALPLIQANAWSRINPEETLFLWQEAMQRAAELEHFLPGTSWRVPAFQQILRQARPSAALRQAAVRAAGEDPVLMNLAEEMNRRK